jgi:hypothetical protein
VEHARGAATRGEAARLLQLTHIGNDADHELVFASADGKIHRAVRAPRT